MPGYSPKQPGVTAHMLGHDEQRTDYNPRQQSLSLEKPIFMSCMGGAVTEIFLACLAATLPILLLSALLLGLIFKYQVDTSETAYSDLQGPSPDAGLGAFYLVDYSATRLMTVASWSSSVACLLTFSIMTLASFPLARQVLHATKSRTSTLPTPYQLGLLLSAMNASLGSLFNWATYASWKDKFPATRIVKVALMTFIFSSTISYAIVACDTWLHVTTTTILYSMIDRQPDITFLGRGIYNNSCASNDGNQFKIPCTINYAATYEWLVGGSEAYRVLANASTKSFVGTFQYEGKTFAYLADSNIPKQRDFSATAFALSTSCTPVSQSCKVPGGGSGQSAPFNCSSAFYGDLIQRKISNETQNKVAGVLFFDDAKFSKRLGEANALSNPFFMGTWAVVPTNELTDDDPLLHDPGMLIPAHGGYGWILSCTATVYDLRYAWINGTFSHVQALTRSNATMASVIAAPWLTSTDYSSFSLTSDAFLASLQNTSAAVASEWANRFSSSAIGLSAGVMSSRQTLQEQQRRDVLVAKVMKAPLWCMVILNLIFVVMGIILTIVALMALKEQNVQEVQARLSTIGLVGALFEGEHSERAVKSPEEWFSEQNGRGVLRQRRIGIGETPAGGFGFVVAEAW